MDIPTAFKHLILFVNLVLLLAACGPGGATKEEADGAFLIAYNVLEDAEKDDYEIYVMNSDGSGKRNISNWEGVDWVYYARQDKLYFISDRDTVHRRYFLYEMDADGGNVRRMTDFMVDDSWFGSRNDGQEWIVRPLRLQNNGFYRIDGKGAILDTLLNDTLPKNDPLFSPDGRQIVFRMTKEGTDELWRMDADGGNLQQLTHYPSGDTSIAQHGYHAGPARWNRAEDFISYQSKQEGKYSLFAVTPDGDRQWKLLDSELNEGYHDWSPDGRWLAVEMFDDAQTQFDIYLIDWASKERTRLTGDSVAYEQAPVFVSQVKSH